MEGSNPALSAAAEGGDDVAGEDVPDGDVFVSGFVADAVSEGDATASFAPAVVAADVFDGVVPVVAAVVVAALRADDSLVLAGAAEVSAFGVAGDFGVAADTDFARGEGFFPCPEARGLVDFATDRPLFAKLTPGVTGAFQSHSSPTTGTLENSRAHRARKAT